MSLPIMHGITGPPKLVTPPIVGGFYLPFLMSWWWLMGRSPLGLHSPLEMNETDASGFNITEYHWYILINSLVFLGLGLSASFVQILKCPLRKQRTSSTEALRVDFTSGWWVTMGHQCKPSCWLAIYHQLPNVLPLSVCMLDHFRAPDSVAMNSCLRYCKSIIRSFYLRIRHLFVNLWNVARSCIVARHVGTYSCSYSTCFCILLIYIQLHSNLWQYTTYVTHIHRF